MSTMPPTPQRLPDAQARLNALLQARMQQPFAWGSTDCALWVADVLQAITGTDLAANVRGRYTTAHQAARLLRPMGGLPGLLAQRLQPAPVMAADGDVALSNRVVGLAAFALAVRVNGWTVGQGENGLVILPRHAVVSWWRLA